MNDAETLDQLVNERLDLTADRVKLDDKIADVDALILATVPVGGRHTLPGMPDVGIRVQGPNKRLDADLAQQHLTPEQYASICESKPTAAKAKANLPGYVVDLFLLAPANGKPTVRAL